MAESIQADHVHGPERGALGMAHRRTGNGIDLFDGHIILQHQLNCLHHGVSSDTVGDKVWRILGKDDSFTKGLFAETVHIVHYFR